MQAAARCNVAHSSEDLTGKGKQFVTSNVGPMSSPNNWPVTSDGINSLQCFMIFRTTWRRAGWVRGRKKGEGTSRPRWNVRERVEGKGKSGSGGVAASGPACRQKSGRRRLSEVWKYYPRESDHARTDCHHGGGGGWKGSRVSPNPSRLAAKPWEFGSLQCGIVWLTKPQGRALEARARFQRSAHAWASTCTTRRVPSSACFAVKGERVWRVRRWRLVERREGFFLTSPLQGYMTCLPRRRSS